MKTTFTKLASTTLFALAVITVSGCASQPQTMLSLDGRTSDQTVVNETAGSTGIEQTLVSKTSESIVVISPQKLTQIETDEDLWFNIVAINKSESPISFSVDNVSSVISGEYLEAPSAEEMEAQRKSEVRKAQAWGLLTMIAGAALVENAGANTEQYLMDASTFMVDMTAEEGEVTDALVAKYEDVVLEEEHVLPKSHHGGLVRFTPPDDDLWYYQPVVVAVDIGGDTHRFEFDVNAEINLPE